MPQNNNPAIIHSINILLNSLQIDSNETESAVKACKVALKINTNTLKQTEHPDEGIKQVEHPDEGIKHVEHPDEGIKNPTKSSKRINYPFGSSRYITIGEEYYCKILNSLNNMPIMGLFYEKADFCGTNITINNHIIAHMEVSGDGVTIWESDATGKNSIDEAVGRFSAPETFAFETTVFQSDEAFRFIYNIAQRYLTQKSIAQL